MIRDTLLIISTWWASWAFNHFLALGGCQPFF